MNRPALTARIRVPVRWRTFIEDEIERLVSILDRIDGDPDFEPDDEDADHDGREPSTDSEDQTTEFKGGSVIAVQ